MASKGSGALREAYPLIMGATLFPPAGFTFIGAGPCAINPVVS